MGKRKTYYTRWKSLREDRDELQNYSGLVEKIMNQLGIEKFSFAGHGTMGDAYYIPNNKILKITTDKTEANESLKIKGKNMSHLANIFEVYKINGPYGGVYIIISEQLEKINDIRELTDELYKFLYEKKLGIATLFNDYLNGEVTKEFMNSLRDEIKEYFSESQNKEKVLWLFDGKMGIVEELKENNIKSTEYNHIPNQGKKKNGNLAVFDLGFGDQEKPEDITYLSLKEDSVALTKFIKPTSEDRRLKDSMQFTGKDGTTFYISDRRDPMMIITSVMTEQGGLRPIGYLYLSHKKDNIYVPDAGKHMAVQVDSDYRRLGVATAMYDYAESVLGLEVIPATLQHDAAKAVWKKRKPEIFEFLSADEYPDFLDGQFNPFMAGKPYPPKMNMNPSINPLAEEEISQEELDVRDLPLKYSNLFDDYVLIKTEAEIREIAPGLDLNQNPHKLILTIQKNHPELYDSFAEWLHEMGKKFMT